MIREVNYFKHYFYEFYNALDERARAKTDFALGILRDLQTVPTDFAKPLVGSRGIYELRVRVGSNQYRVLFFFETGNLKGGGRVVVLGNGFLKKDNRDYKRAVALAEKIRDQYFEEKK